MANEVVMIPKEMEAQFKYPRKAEWGPERHRLHRKIADYFTVGRVPQQAPIGIILMGGPGAGKSTYYHNMLARRYDPDSYVYINRDSLLPFLPEYQRGLHYCQTVEQTLQSLQQTDAPCAPVGNLPIRTGAVYFGVLKYLITNIKDRIFRHRLSFIYDTTGSDFRDITGMLQRCLARNYSVRIYWVKAEVGLVVDRIQQRAKTELRTIDPDILPGIYDKISQNFQKLLQNKEIRHLKQVELYQCDNQGPYTTQLAELESRCRLIYSKRRPVSAPANLAARKVSHKRTRLDRPKTDSKPDYRDMEKHTDKKTARAARTARTAGP